MAKREPLVEVDLGDNGGLLRLWSMEDVDEFIAREEEFWRTISQGSTAQPFGVANQRMGRLGAALRQRLAAEDLESAASAVRETYSDTNTRIPISSSAAGQALLSIAQTLGREPARGALAATVPVGIWPEGLSHESRPFWRGMIEQAILEAGVTPKTVEATRRSLNGINSRVSQVLAAAEGQASARLGELEAMFNAALEKQDGRNSELERRRVVALNQFTAQAEDIVATLKATQKTYLEQMKLKAPVEYWRSKAAEHRKSAKDLRNWLAGFFVLMMSGYGLAFAGLHQQIASFLLQFQGSTGALLIISAALAIAASLPLWIGRLLVKFYLSEHHLATDAKEREIMTQTYLALTDEGAVDEKDRSLILAALFRSTPDGVVKDNTQPDTSAAALLSKILDAK